MNRKNVGVVTCRYTVYKHVSSWNGNFRCAVWNLEFQSDNKQEAYDFYEAHVGGHWELNDESKESAKTISMSSY